MSADSENATSERGPQAFFDVLLDALQEGRAFGPADLEFARGYYRRALARGVDQQELVRSAQLWLRVVVDELHALAGPDGAAAVAEVSRALLDHVEAAGREAVGLVAEIAPARQLTERVRRAELVDDLVAGRPLSAAAQSIARAGGLEPHDPVMAISARAASHVSMPEDAHFVGLALARAAQDAIEPLVCVRGSEITILRAGHRDVVGLVDRLGKAQHQLAAESVTLAVGVSGLHHGLARVPAAYEEAVLAREGVSSGGLLAICTLDPLDYLLLRAGDETAWNLVPESIRAFVDSDATEGGQLSETFEAYVAANRNAKQAADALSVHANTVYYRLGKVEQLAAIDLHNVLHVQQLSLALRLARVRSGSPRGPVL